ncbi:hypothetical protein SAMN05216228_104140 [Rhizobium tibeticum]|uniref:Uncharacterized protein n=1 Tax=Rhizobium tibeticum TaxID=501024 RepID=A0A1H8VCX4_9HYPH|nr:hypothetical protein RTCCBAU85039_5970 [Rhizobium tibeticum]SEP13286.1 hypothetical protein SAMN05216228_104140 [Rhizobium tibeticum]
MSMCLGLIHGLQHAGEQVAEQRVQALRGSDVHPVPTSNRNKREVVCVNDSRSQADVDYAIVMPQLRDDVDIFDRRSAVSNLPVLGSDRNLPSAANNYFVLTHRYSPSFLAGTSIRLTAKFLHAV